MNGIKMDILGEKIGDLEVICLAPSQVRMSNGRKITDTMWSCRCSCGNIKSFSRSVLLKRRKELKDGTILTNHCGCKQKLEYGEGAFRQLLHNYKWGANKRGLEFELGIGFFRKITKQNCHYCGVEPFSTKVKSGYNGSYIYNGVDRMNSFEGYTEDNVVSCCKTCNIAKRSMSKQEFLDWITRVYKYSCEKRIDNTVKIEEHILN